MIPITTMLVNTGSVLPHEMALRLERLALYKAIEEIENSLCPLLVHLSWCTSQELVQDLEDDKTDGLRENTRSNGQTLHDKVRNIEVRYGWQARGQKICNSGWIIDDRLDNRRSGRCNRGDEEDLDDLEYEVCILCEKLNACQRRFARKFCAY